jgi:voltage-gated potassium channel
MILVFLSVLLTVVMVIVTLIDVVEGPKDLFTSISVSIYLAVTTMATVGFGDRAEYRSRSIHLLRDDADRGGQTGGTLWHPNNRQSLPQIATEPTNRTCGKFMTEGLAADGRFCRHCGESVPAFQAASSVLFSNRCLIQSGQSYFHSL